jgi:hypothetical protein
MEQPACREAIPGHNPVVRAHYPVCQTPMAGRAGEKVPGWTGLDLPRSNHLGQRCAVLEQGGGRMLSWLKVKQRAYRVEERGWTSRNKTLVLLAAGLDTPQGVTVQMRDDHVPIVQPDLILHVPGIDCRPAPPSRSAR